MPPQPGAKYLPPWTDQERRDLRGLITESCQREKPPTAFELRAEFAKLHGGLHKARAEMYDKEKWRGVVGTAKKLMKTQVAAFTGAPSGIVGRGARKAEAAAFSAAVAGGQIDANKLGPGKGRHRPDYDADVFDATKNLAPAGPSPDLASAPSDAVLLTSAGARTELAHVLTGADAQQAAAFAEVLGGSLPAAALPGGPQPRAGEDDDDDSDDADGDDGELELDPNHIPQFAADFEEFLRSGEATAAPDTPSVEREGSPSESQPANGEDAQALLLQFSYHNSSADTAGFFEAMRLPLPDASAAPAPAKRKRATTTPTTEPTHPAARAMRTTPRTTTASTQPATRAAAASTWTSAATRNMDDEDDEDGEDGEDGEDDEDDEDGEDGEDDDDEDDDTWSMEGAFVE